MTHDGRIYLSTQLGFGTGTAWYKPDGKGPFDQSLVDILNKAIGAGFSHIDCADAYGTEEELGVAIREFGVWRATLHHDQGPGQRLQYFPSHRRQYLIYAPFFAKNDEDLQKANYLRPHLEATLRTAVSPPVINQIEFQPCLQQNGIQFVAFKILAPLTKGKGGPLDALLETLGKKYDVEPSAILFNWHNQQNVVAIATTWSPDRLEQEMEEITQIGLSHHFRAAHQKKFDVNDRT
ncbi:aldo-keto reductase family protein [Metarhizium robertsii]|uniref:Aldo-keto reductase family protein n=1 Tax=Metarhizium robertsii TaxID=568076 RepID=A0A014N929_9HYPO|nr:aldo-keto reductase family protein [Metarhizium robertsii]